MNKFGKEVSKIMIDLDSSSKEVAGVVGFCRTTFRHHCNPTKRGTTLSIKTVARVIDGLNRIARKRGRPPLSKRDEVALLEAALSDARASMSKDDGHD